MMKRQTFAGANGATRRNYFAFTDFGRSQERFAMIGTPFVVSNGNERDRRLAFGRVGPKIPLRHRGMRTIREREVAAMKRLLIVLAILAASIGSAATTEARWGYGAGANYRSGYRPYYGYRGYSYGYRPYSYGGYGGYGGYRPYGSYYRGGYGGYGGYGGVGLGVGVYIANMPYEQAVPWRKGGPSLP